MSSSGQVSGVGPGNVKTTKLPPSYGVIMETSGMGDSYSGESDRNLGFSDEKMRNVFIALSEIQTIKMESLQLTMDALKCFEDNVSEMRRLKNFTQNKVDAVRKMVAVVAPVVGVSSTTK